MEKSDEDILKMICGYIIDTLGLGLTFILFTNCHGILTIVSVTKKHYTIGKKS